MLTSSFISSFQSIGRKHRLILSHLSAKQSGYIKIKAGSAISEARLQVLEPPVEFVQGLKDVKVEETSDARLECEVRKCFEIGVGG